MQESFDAEYVLLLVMKNQTHSPDGSKWASNYSMVKTEAKDFKVRQFLDNAALAEKIKVLSRQHSKNKHKQAQAHPSHGSEKKTSRAATTVVVGAVPTSRLRVLVEPSSFHTCPVTGFAPLSAGKLPDSLLVQTSIVLVSCLAAGRLAISCLTRHVQRTRRSGARRKQELIMHLPK